MIARSLLAGLIVLVTPVSEAAIAQSQLVKRLGAGEKQVVVAYGTSLTAAGAWVGHLQSALQKRYPGQAEVINSGGSGKWSQWGVENLDNLVIQKNPDTVFIEFSINDCVARFGADSELARKNLETMIGRILQSRPRCEIILMTMTPGDAHPVGHKSYRKDIEEHYAMYRRVAKERQLLLIDHYPNWKALQQKDPEKFRKYIPDGVHPTADACREVVTPVLLKALGLE